MIKKLAIVLTIVLLAYLGWLLLTDNNVIGVTINGHELKGPLGNAAGVWGLLMAGIILFCVAILLVFVFTSVGLIVLGSFLFVGLILALMTLPFLLPILLPLFVVWAFCSIVRRKKPA